MSRTLDLLRAVLRWSDAALWHSWVVHTVAAVPLALVFGFWPTAVFFTLREAEQFAHAAMAGHYEPWYDYGADVLGPLVVAWLLA